MSMLGNIGAEAAAKEILGLLKEKIAECQDRPEIVEVLREIETKAQGIVESAEAGWY